MFDHAHRLAFKHVAAVLSVSALFTTVNLLIQANFFYLQELELRNQAIASVEDSYLLPTAAAVFFFEDYQLRLLVEGMLQLPYIDAVIISEYVAGEYQRLIQTAQINQNTERFDFPLVYEYEGESRHVGKLTIYSGLNHIWPRIMNTLRNTAFFSVFIMLGMAVVVVVISNRMIFRHLSNISDFAHSIKPGNLHNQQLTLRRPTRSRQDELDVITDGLNAMLNGLRSELLTSTSLNTLLNAIIDSPQDISVFALDTEFRYLAFTSSHQVDMSQIWNASIVRGTSILNYIPDETRRLYFQHCFERSLNGECITTKEEIFQSDGVSAVYEHRYNPLYDQYGVISGVTVFSIDVTKKTQAEKALELSEEKYRTLFETMSPGVIYQDADGNITSANPAAERLLGLSVASMNGMSSDDERWRMINDNGDAVPGMDHPAMMALRTGTKVGPVLRGVYIPEKASYIWLQITAIPLFMTGSRKASEVYATFDDVTALKTVEESLAQQLSLKEQLIQELFHRTNNNMQVIQGLLGFHESAHPEQSIAQAGEAIRQQIQAMSLAHQQLYQQKNLNRLPLREFLPSIVDNIIEYSSNSQPEVQVRYEIGDISVLLDSGVPLGLITTLLIQAFMSHVRVQLPIAGGCELQISVYQQETGDIELWFSSNLVEWEFESTTDSSSQEIALALSILESQLNGVFEITEANQQTCIIRFNDNTYRERIHI